MCSLCADIASCATMADNSCQGCVTCAAGYAKAADSQACTKCEVANCASYDENTCTCNACAPSYSLAEDKTCTAVSGLRGHAAASGMV